MSPPILSPYKLWFAVRRILQTFLGGPKLVPSISIILFQAIIYVVPVCIIVCVVNVVEGSALRWEWKALLAGMGILLTDVALTFLIWILKQRKDANINPEDAARESSDNFNTSASLFDEEEAVPGDGCFRSSTWRFIASNVNMSMCHFSAVLASAISTFLCVSILADKQVHPVLKGFVIFTICNARYSSVINAAPEVATFDPIKRRHLFYRPFYISIVAAINFAIIVFSVKENVTKEVRDDLDYNDQDGNSSSLEPSPSLETYSSYSSGPSFSCSSYFALVISLMPLIWLCGVLPPLDALFPWLLELMLSAFGGKSIGYTYFGTTISLAFAIVGPLATFILSQEPRITYLLECLCAYLISCDTGSMPKLKASLCEDIPVKYFLQQLIKPSVTIACSLLSIFVVGTTAPHTSSIPSREIFHPVFASISIFIVVTTKLVQMSDVMQRNKWAASRLCLSIFTMWHGLLTILLHIWLTLELITEHLESIRATKSLEAVVHSLQQLLPCILTIRFFALAITEPHDSTINIFVTYIITLLIPRAETETVWKFIRILFLVSIAHSILKRFTQYLRMIVIFTHATFTSTLLNRKYVAGAALISMPLTLFSLVVTSVVKGMSLVPMFTLPIFTIGFPRPQSFWKGFWFLRHCGHNESQRILPVATSVDWTIYSDVAPLLVHEFAKRSEGNKIDLDPGSCFIARHDDRLIFIRIVSAGWKFMYVQVKGLETQEQTSCHHQEAAWIDEMFEKYLHSQPTCFRKVRTYPMSIINSLAPTFFLVVPSYSESKSQLPSFLSREGKAIFRDMFFRAFSYLWIKGNPAFQGESYRRPIASGVHLGKHGMSKMQPRLLDRSQSNLRNGQIIVTAVEDRNSFQLGSMAQPGSMSGPDYNGNRAETLLKEVQSQETINSSSGSLRGASAPMRQHPQMKDLSATNWQGSVSYPLIPGLPNLAMEDSEMESLSLSLSQCTNENNEPKEIINASISPPSDLTSRSRNAWDGLPQFWMKQCVGDAIPHNAVKARVEKLCWKAWEIAFGTNDDLYEVDIARFYRREFTRNVRTAILHEKSYFEELAVQAFRYATKLTLDEIYASGIDIEDSSSAPISSSASRRQNICNVDVPENTSPIARTEQDEQEIFQQLASFEKTYRFCPYDEVPYWMHEKTSHIVSISADGDTNILRIFNYENDGVEFAVGELSRQCVEGIWGSLNTELLYFTSDDDERYSIQHSKYLLRNICAQSAQTLGYPVYEATFRVNLFDFSLEQVSPS